MPDLLDRPHVAVFDAERAVLLGKDDAIAKVKLRVTNLEASRDREFPFAETFLLGKRVQGLRIRNCAREDERVLEFGSAMLTPGLDEGPFGLVVGLGEMEPVRKGKLCEGLFRLALGELVHGVAEPFFSLSNDRGQRGGPEPLHHRTKSAACFDGLQLTRITDSYELRARLLARGDESRQAFGIDHARFVENDDCVASELVLLKHEGGILTRSSHQLPHVMLKDVTNRLADPPQDTVQRLTQNARTTLE